jgi:hypothetical protein
MKIPVMKSWQKLITPAITPILAALTLSGGIITSTVTLAPKPAAALTQEQVAERLQRIPVFVLIDDKGKPVEIPLQGANRKPEDPDREVAFFMSPEDAQLAWNTLRNNNTITNLPKQVGITGGTMVDFFAMQSGNKDRKLRISLIAGRQNLISASRLMQSDKLPEDKIRAVLSGIPVFYASSGADKPAFPVVNGQDGKPFQVYFMDAQDLQDELELLNRRDPNQAKNLKIRVTSMSALIGDMLPKDGKTSSGADQTQFVPSQRVGQLFQLFDMFFFTTQLRGQNPQGGTTPAVPPRR